MAVRPLKRDMRLFTAILLPDNPRSYLARIIRHYREDLDLRIAERGYTFHAQINWIRDENLHVTMKFLGEVPESDVPPLCDALSRIGPLAPMELRIGRPECLPPRGPVRIICAAIAGDTDLLQLTYTLIERACEPFGVPRERRAFHPHITLARLRHPLPWQLRKFFRDDSGLGPSFEAAEVALVQSELLATGPRYTILDRFPPARSTP
jgi:RNA 2',3'-cyclic 3'-phosphodiesterase